MTLDDSTLLTRFLDRTIDGSGFDHEAHVRVTYLLLRDRPLPETMIALRDVLRSLTAAAGHPEKYHETMTFALAAIINERMIRGTSHDWESFKRDNSDLLAWRGGAMLHRYYAPHALTDEEARHTFLLPR